MSAKIQPLTRSKGDPRITDMTDLRLSPDASRLRPSRMLGGFKPFAVGLHSCAREENPLQKMRRGALCESCQLQRLDIYPDYRHHL
ncbi:uncharacterized protein BKA78DRAFT_34615 [Phyllosticta capitalensis]|uniref:uncharacterized protein n=1 Tax=Phyllosticta capitalensis TaxID=121624 RepID=UPI00312FAA9C